MKKIRYIPRREYRIFVLVHTKAFFRYKNGSFCIDIDEIIFGKEEFDATSK